MEKESRITDETVVHVMDLPYSIKVFRRINGRHFAVTRFSEYDAIITDGASAEAVVEQHAYHLSLALSAQCRRGTFAAADKPSVTDTVMGRSGRPRQGKQYRSALRDQATTPLETATERKRRALGTTMRKGL